MSHRMFTLGALALSALGTPSAARMLSRRAGGRIFFTPKPPQIFCQIGSHRFPVTPAAQAEAKAWLAGPDEDATAQATVMTAPIPLRVCASMKAGFDGKNPDWGAELAECRTVAEAWARDEGVPEDFWAFGRFMHRMELNPKEVSADMEEAVAIAHQMFHLDAKYKKEQEDFLGTKYGNVNQNQPEPRAKTDEQMHAEMDVDLESERRSIMVPSTRRRPRPTEIEALRFSHKTELERLAAQYQKDIQGKKDIKELDGALEKFKKKCEEKTSKFEERRRELVD